MSRYDAEGLPGDIALAHAPQSSVGLSLGSSQIRQVLLDPSLSTRLLADRFAQNRCLRRLCRPSVLATRQPTAGTPEFGKAFEHLILLELLAYRAYRDPDLAISYWRTAGGREVDFLIGDRRLAIEVKSSTRVHPTDLSGLTALREEGPVQSRLVVSLAAEPARLSDRFGTIDNLPLADFVERLWAGNLL